jgi:hypothetical protein
MVRISTDRRRLATLVTYDAFLKQHTGVYDALVHHLCHDLREMQQQVHRLLPLV